MNDRTLAFLVVVAAILIGGVLVLKRGSRSAPAERLGAPELADRADRLEVRGPSGAFSLVRSSRTWRMEAPVSYPADSDALERLVGGLSDVRLSDELSSDPARYAMFGLSDSSAAYVRLSSSKAVGPLEFYVGKEGPEPDTAFLRFPGKPGVVEASGMSAGAFSKATGDWLDKTLCLPRLGAVEALAIRGDKTRTDLKLADGRWRSSDSGVALSTRTAAESVEPALETLRDLTADRLILAQDAPKPEASGLSRPEMAIEARAAGGAACSLRFGKKDATGLRYASRTGESRVYFQIYDWRLDSLRKKELTSPR